MKVLVIAVLVAVASGGYARRVRTFGRRDSPVRYGAGQTFKDVVELLEELTRVKQDLYEGLGSYGTNLRVSEQKINRIYQRDIPSIVLSNKQQDGLITLANGEIDDLLAQVRSAQDTAAATLVTATETSNITEVLEQQVYGIASWNAEQRATIDGINITEVTQVLLQELKDSIYRLRTTLAGLETRTNTVDVFVQSRRCETGSVQVFFEYDKDEVTVPQTFLSAFDENPEVTISLDGFADSIDDKGEYQKNRYDNDGKNNYDNNYGKNNYKDGKINYDNNYGKNNYDNNYGKNNYDNNYGKNNFDKDGKIKNDVRYNEKDELGIRVSAEQITTSGFNARFKGFSEGRFENRVATARWTACQNLSVRPPRNA
ncbi:hypothetical protein C0Q70_07687 [Pomacea canaliculata]|uniref:Fibrinogen C-terminal domain-containing protein n=1 Tax=Pomacea canaliculata TaxID=400727 RepID=A0A2T7PFR2_POMCA|nr:putative uncharacterized protein DDB_G0279653 [Pomacea canaliculata]PVD32254.1 hypothetical protein C0Q70_07687 [Pomacea canaliculata]